MRYESHTEHIPTIIIGAGQAGLSAGYFLARQGLPFVILDASERIGDAWRHRWDSLHLFTPARFDGLAGMPFPAPADSFPSKNEMADYLEAYASRFHLPVKTGIKVDGVSRQGERYTVTAAGRRFVAEHVIIAMAMYQEPRTPSFARDLRPEIVQIHSKDYRNPGQLRSGDVLIVGAGNSGAEIALDVARKHGTWLAGRDTGHIPFRINGFAARLVLQRLFLRVVFHRILTINTGIGRKARPKLLSQGSPLIRVKPKDLQAAGVRRVPRITGVQDGFPVLEDGRVLPVSNVIWCTGFNPGFSWIHLPIFDESGLPKHQAGVAVGEPGLYFIGLPFIYAFSSTMVHGIARDAERIAKIIEKSPSAGSRELSTAAT